MKRLVLITLLSLVTSMNVACAKKKSSGPGPAPAPDVIAPNGPFVPPGDGPGNGPGEDWQYGATVSLSISSLSVMSQYTGRPMNQVKNPRLNLNLVKHGNAYGGTVAIRYEENNNTYQGFFTSGDTDKSNQYNIWFTYGGKDVWHGIFEDYLGGLVVVINDVVDLGDGQGPQDEVGGVVYFKNFGLTYAPHPPTYCWFVSLGPYDCRAWPSGTGMSTTSSDIPTGASGYKKLGSFHDMSLEDAFNGELSL